MFKPFGEAKFSAQGRYKQQQKLGQNIWSSLFLHMYTGITAIVFKFISPYYTVYTVQYVQNDPSHFGLLTPDLITWSVVLSDRRRTTR